MRKKRCMNNWRLRFLPLAIQWKERKEMWQRFIMRRMFVRMKQYAHEMRDWWGLILRETNRWQINIAVAFSRVLTLNRYFSNIKVLWLQFSERRKVAIQHFSIICYKNIFEILNRSVAAKRAQVSIYFNFCRVAQIIHIFIYLLI
jgi:hypothetical protein